MAIALVHTVDKETKEIVKTIEREWDSAIAEFMGVSKKNSFYYISMKGGKAPPYKFRQPVLKSIIPKADKEST